MIRALSQVIAMAALAVITTAAWLWLFYRGPLAMWWRREYIYAVLSVVVVAGVATSFVSARRSGSVAYAAKQAGLMLLGCAGVVTLAYLIAAWFFIQFGA